MIQRDIIAEMGALRNNLLDLTLRNNLLNYNASTKRTVQVVGMTPDKIYNALVLHEKSLKFSVRGEKNKKARTGEATQQGNEASPAISVLMTSETIETLEPKLLYLYNQATSFLEDQGYPALYLAVGFLQWEENGKAPIAPILLIPVEMKRAGKTRAFHITWTGEEVYTSITLQAKLKDQNVYIPDFPMPEDAAGIKQYFSRVAEAIEHKKGWKVIPEIQLDLFNFRKFVMYKDLDPALWSTELIETEHPLIKKVFGGETERYKEQGFNAEEVDLRIQAHNSFNVVDADSSQIAVIEDAKAGLCLVVEGPPGTGKSQTIVNMIAELMAQGKSVLFISEKMAALQVVKSRLDNVGLGELCLELHSNQTRKNEMLGRIEKTLGIVDITGENYGIELQEIYFAKKELNNYAATLREPIGCIYPTFYALHGTSGRIRNHFRTKGYKMPVYPITEPEKWQPSEWNESMFVLTKLAEIAPALVPIQSNPWYGCEPELILPTEIPEISEMITESRENLNSLTKSMSTLSKLSSIKEPSVLENIENAIDAAALLPGLSEIPDKLRRDPIWGDSASVAEIRNLISRLEEYQKLKSELERTFTLGILEIDPAEFQELSGKLLKLVDKRYKKLKNEIMSCYTGQKPTNDKEILADLQLVTTCRALKSELENLESLGKKYYMECWKGVDSDVNHLKSYMERLIAFRVYIATGYYESNVLDHIEVFKDKEVSKELEIAIAGAIAQKNVFMDSIAKVKTRLNVRFSIIFAGSPEISMSALGSCMLGWQCSLYTLVFWSQYINYRKTCMKTRAAYLIQDFEHGRIEPIDLIPIFEGNYVEALLYRNFKTKPALNTFIKELQEGKIKKFSNVDKKLLIANRKRVSDIVKTETKKARVDPANSAALKVLLNEFSKKRRHLPIRALMCKSGKFIQKIKPCFMMSPLSVAQYLDPRNSTTFDVIIFDEASQIKPEDAIGTLLRGRQVIVMGDSKQLPPTDFFDKVIEFPENHFDEFGVGDVESILNICKRSFTVKSLNWHYRSRHESLITISNRLFYENKLHVYPSPFQKDEELGLKFVHLPNAVYERGKTGVNREEAKAVAVAVFNHYVTYPEKSLGVGTFNIKQQEAIREEIEALSKKFPNIEINNGKEPFFVKNLETIQGDERDVIFLSVGFGFDAQKKLALNFGALNQDGGERRLNVLITRAREKCVIFANFKAKDLVLDNTASVGLQALKTFLDFAENGKIDMDYNTAITNESFEDTVRNFLIGQGYEVHKNIGCSGYKMDLALPDPENPGRYVLGIECDGANYHDLKVCRDRDRLRTQILEGLGWKLYQVWSTDWYLHPEESRNALLTYIRGVLKPSEMRVVRDVQPSPEVSATSL